MAARKPSKILMGAPSGAVSDLTVFGTMEEMKMILETRDWPSDRISYGLALKLTGSDEERGFAS
jgi:hypothetical protein